MQDQCEPTVDTVAAITGKPSIRERPLLPPDQAVEVAGTFKMLANESRLRILQVLARDGELCVSDLAGAVDMTPQAVSNQLRRLVDRRVVGSRRDGNYIFYRIIDPCVPGILEFGLCLTEEARQAAMGSRT